MLRQGRVLWVLGLVVAIALAVGASWWASDVPDGLERVAEDHGFAAAAEEHDLAGSPVADYRAEGIDDEGLAGSVAGVVGVGVTLVVAGGLLWLARRRAAAPRDP